MKNYLSANSFKCKLEKGARLLSILSNLTDVFRKVNAKSDPVVRTVKPPVSCKHCHQVGHSTRGCKVLAAERNPQELSEDDVAIWSYVKPDQRPATVAGAAENFYVDEESEDNDSEEEGDIDEDMMDIDWDDRRTFGLSYIVKLSVIVGTTENKGFNLGS